ncbi:MAG: SPFH domain-containing protein [Acidobacteria bacterium]|nr:SPFH domain-containing protein [Acidobacteriota bacterium]
MNMWAKVRGEFIDIIQWTDDSNDTLIHRFERYGNQIKYGARLTVREGQAAVFINEGRIADVFYPGMYTLETRNLPILSTMQGWKYGFNSPFLAEVYFCSTRQFTDLKWGTQKPIIMRDAEFGPVRLRAFGTYAISVKDPAVLLRQLSGTDGRFTLDEIVNQLRNLILSRFADMMGESKIPVLDLASSYNELGELLAGQIEAEFHNYGLELVTFLIENISLPAEVEQALDRRTSMGVVGDLSEYTRFNVADSIPAAAANPGGLAAAGAGVGIGMAMAGPVTQAVSNPSKTPPPIPGTAQYFLAVEDRQEGPFNMSGLSSRVASGVLTRQTLVWTEGMVQWEPAGQVAALESLFKGSPPPLPAA